MADIHTHDPNTCPNKTLIDQVNKEVRSLRTDMHAMDKELAVNDAERRTQYSTIIEILSGRAKVEDTLIQKVSDLEKRFVLNEHITNKTADAFSKITWGVIGKFGSIIILSGVVVAWIVSIWKG